MKYRITPRRLPKHTTPKDYRPEDTSRLNNAELADAIARTYNLVRGTSTSEAIHKQLVAHLESLLQIQRTRAGKP
jgi:hypothetical protein